MPRIYAVENNDEITLVKAETQSQALNHVVKSQYKVRVASALDVCDYMQQGGTVEEAGAPVAEEGTGEPE